jgi:hypothetical protein
MRTMPARWRVCALLWLAPALGVPAVPAEAQQTRAERTGYTETSSHADVMAFVDSLARAGASIRRGVLATSPQGREVPWLLAARPMVDGPGEAHRSGKPVIYLQGNIHGGEVEGKEAAQMLLRDLTLGPLRPLLDSVILLVVPIYNSDGNDAFGPGARQRPGQNGPEVVGLRPNGQGLDLNRDYVKQEAPETRGAARLITAWDPDLFVDLHTTNGSYHGYALTYSPGLNANSTPANDWARDRFLPEVRRRVRDRHGRETYWYGNFRNQHPDSLAQGWWTYEGHPRYGTNWFGMRGRVAILSEAYSNDDFRTRVASTYAFALEIIRLAAERRETLKAVAAASGTPPDSVAVRSAFADPVMDDVIAEITVPAGAGAGGFARRQRTGEFRTIRMPVYDRFAAVRREAVPAAYLVPPQHGHLVEALRRHGVRVARLEAEWEGPVEAFRMDSAAWAPRPFEGHHLARVEGAWRARDARIGPGWYLVPIAGRLGMLAAFLLEPASEDGFVAWNFVDRDLRPGMDFPVVRVRRPLPVAATDLP